MGDWFTTGDGALGGVAQNLKRFIGELLAREPAIGFLDEIEALPDRRTMDNRGKDWWTPIITLFLTEIDRLRKSGRKVMLLGATNYYEHLDAALVRPSRLQQRISVLPPQTEAEVGALLRYYIKDDLPGTDLMRLARIGRGATPAMVEGWLKQARAEARARQRPLDMNDILALMVPEDNRSPEDIRAVAIHECGHAVVAHRLGRIVDSVSIIPEGNSCGRMISRLPTLVPVWSDVQDTVTVTLSGRAADIVLGRGPNTGAEADLANATSLLVDAFDRHGLRGDLTYVPALGARSSAAVLGIGVELRRLLDQAIAIIKDNRGLVLELAELLIVKKVLSGADVAHVLGRGPNRTTTKRRARRRKDEPALSRAVRKVMS